ncbi:MAG: threonine synthase [Thermoanaerobaculia bacterium]|nr:threonine synthase [Thermoanaerobaculia bacterium]
MTETSALGPAVAGSTRSALSHLECSSTGERHEADTLHTISRAGRPLLARYDLDRAAHTLTFDRLASRRADMWRYAEVMPVRDVQHVVSLAEGMTPLLAVPRLGAELGLRHLWIKDEGRNPTGTFKARGLSAAMSRASELGASAVALPTAGNAGAAAAAYAARAGLPCHVAMPRDAPQAVQGEVRSYGAELTLIDGLIHDAGAWIAQGCSKHGWLDLATLREPYRLEGKKTMGYELWEQFAARAVGVALPDVIVYPTGGGTGLIGMWKAFAELIEMGKIEARLPRMISVQPCGCAPVVRAYEAGQNRAEPWENAHTVAPGIRVPRVFADDLVLAAIYESGGRAVAVSDEAIVEAMHRLSRLEGLDPAPEGAATLAALDLLVQQGHVDRDEHVVLFDCGTGLKHPELRPAS